MFCRDCLMAQIGDLTILLYHFKAPWPNASNSWLIRRLEALAVRRLIERRFLRDTDAFWLVVGNLNEPEAGQECEQGRKVARCPIDHAASGAAPRSHASPKSVTARGGPASSTSERSLCAGCRFCRPVTKSKFSRQTPITDAAIGDQTKRIRGGVRSARLSGTALHASKPRRDRRSTIQ